MLDVHEGSGHVVEEAREVSGFTAIQAESFLNVYYRQGAEYAVEVKADDNLLAHVETEMVGESLRIGFAKNWNVRNATVEVHVVAPNVERLYASGASDIYVSSAWEAQHITLKTDGAADISAKEAPIEARELIISASGSSDIVISDVVATTIAVNTSGSSGVVLDGMADTIEIDAGGSSDVKAEPLQVLQADITTSGSSDVLISVTESLRARASGSSDINYWGRPASVDANTSGSADVTAKN